MTIIELAFINRDLCVFTKLIKQESKSIPKQTLETNKVVFLQLWFIIPKIKFAKKDCSSPR